MNDKFRASYTILNAWASGNWEQAIKYYFKLEQFTTQEMYAGREMHKEWADFINEHKRLPDVFGGAELKNPVAEQKIVVQMEPWLELVFIADCIDSPDLHEFKSGKTNSEVYAGSWQTGIYAVGATMAGHLVERAVIHHYDQYMKKSDTSYRWITDRLLEDAYNYVITVASEMHNYFIVNGLYRQYGANLQKTINE